MEGAGSFGAHFFVREISTGDAMAVPSLMHRLGRGRPYDLPMSAIFSSGAPPDVRGGDDDVARLRVPPHSAEAEQSVLGETA